MNVWHYNEPIPAEYQDGRRILIYIDTDYYRLIHYWCEWYFEDGNEVVGFDPDANIEAWFLIPEVNNG